MAAALFVKIDDFGALPDHVRENALAKIEHADAKILDWAEQPDGVSIRLKDTHGVDGLEERVRTLIQETIASFRFFRSETLDEDEGAPINAVSPFAALVASGQVAMTGPGVPVYQGDFARRLTVLDDRLREIAWSRGAVEQLYPTTVPTRSLTANGYLASYPQHALLAASIHRDVDCLSRAADMAKADGVGYAGQVCEMLEAADEVLSPTVCYRCF
ncbi:MAG: hypothetical protein JSS35_01080 [Proteobacteria bacterium]|nr:hypothetical protein [Pseudomonadota bacterium]